MLEPSVAGNSAVHRRRLIDASDGNLRFAEAPEEVPGVVQARPIGISRHGIGVADVGEAAPTQAIGRSATVLDPSEYRRLMRAGGPIP